LPHSGNKSDALFKIENFLRHNFANLLSVEPAHIIGVKCHRNVPSDAQFVLPSDTIICEVVLLNACVAKRSMAEIVKTFKSHLQTMDFSSWKIYVGSQYVTVQELSNQKFLLLIKDLSLTLSKESLDCIAKIQREKQKHLRSRHRRHKKRKYHHRRSKSSSKRGKRQKSKTSKKRKRKKYKDESDSHSSYSAESEEESQSESGNEDLDKTKDDGTSGGDDDGDNNSSSDDEEQSEAANDNKNKK